MTPQTRSIAQPLWQWETGWADENNEPELGELFVRSFGHTMSKEQWRWKYAQAKPWGALVRTNGIPAAFYGGMPRQVRIFGQAATAVQIGDVMVDPAYRRILTRRGPFFQAASAFAERMVGPGKPYQCAFGFPSERHNRLGEHLGLYGRIGTLLEARWEPLPYRRSLAVTVRSLDQAQGTLVSRLWEQMAERLAGAVVLERDYDYIQHRFLQHPTVLYTLLLVRRRFAGTPAGLLVLRDHGAEGVELLDMIAPPERLSALVTIARRIAGKLGRPRLFSWLTAPVAQMLQSSAPQLKELNIPLPTIIRGVPSDILATSGRWWLMGGDTDSR